MKKIFLYAIFPFFTLLLLSLKTGTPNGMMQPVIGGPGDGDPAEGKLAVGIERESALSCGPPIAGAGIGPAADGSYAPVFPGWGNYHYRVTTARYRITTAKLNDSSEFVNDGARFFSDSAQFFFDQGLSLYYGFHLTESLASFREAARKDSGCMMAYWGQALAMGPYYNNTYYYKMSPEVLPVLERMNRLAGNARVKERDLVGVMNKRYSADTTDSHRAGLNKAYSTGMKDLIGKYPDDPDIKALYIDGVMTEHSWDLWDNKGAPKPWTPELLSYCEAILAVSPNHPAALHYHIHLLEASLHPEAMLASAEKLRQLMPGVAHMVHMASHAYQRTGRYAQGVAINDKANAAQRYYDSLARELHLGNSVIHYHAVEAFCALNGAMYEKGMEAANRCRQQFAGNWPALHRTTIQYLYMMPAFVLVRLGKWQEILRLPVPDSTMVYAGLLSDFARGLALLHTGKMQAARLCLDSLRGKLKDTLLTIRRFPSNAPIEGATVAERILTGEIQSASGRTKEAMTAFREAIEREDGMSYGEPKDWPLPARHFAGAWLLKLKRAREAEKLYREDLVQNPGNGWSMLGLSQSMDALHERGASEYRAKAREAFAAAETMPGASAY